MNKIDQLKIEIEELANSYFEKTGFEFIYDHGKKYYTGKRSMFLQNNSITYLQMSLSNSKEISYTNFKNQLVIMIQNKRRRLADKVQTRRQKRHHTFD